MPKLRKSRRGRKKKPLLVNSKSEKNSSAKKQSPASSTSETSPFRGFSDKEDPINKEELFDRLLEPVSSNLRRNIKTYSNKKKTNVSECRLLEFHDCKNREQIIHWLNDNQNLFDKLTQTQPQDSYSVMSDVTFDMPSVSQQNTPRSRKKKKIKPRSPYKLRARSLDITIEKNGRKCRNKRHSLAGGTPSLEYLHIDEIVTNEDVAIPAQKDAINLIDLMEDEYLDNIEREITTHKNQNLSGWDRLKDMNKSITIKKPKQLDIVLQSGEKKEPESFPCYDYEVLENYFVENMEKILSKQESPSTDERFTLRNAINVGKNFLMILKKLNVNGKEKELEDIIPIVTEIKQVFAKFGKTNSTQTSEITVFDKNVQTVLNVITTSVQTELETVDSCMQTSIANLCNKNLQTESNTTNAEVQTENFDSSKIILNRQSTVASTTPSDLLFADDLDREQVNKAFENAFILEEEIKKNEGEVCCDELEEERKNESENKKPVQCNELEEERKNENENERKAQCDDFDDDFDFNFNTEELVKACKDKIIIKDKKDSQLSLIVPCETARESLKGVKRSHVESPCKAGGNRSKRPCAKFIHDDLSVTFSTCDEENEENEGKVMEFSQECDNYEEYYIKFLKKHEDAQEKVAIQSTSKTRSQEQIEEFENMIYNATKPTGSNGHEKNNNVCKSIREDDLDYFLPISSANDKSQKTCRDLFDRKSAKENQFSESLFFCDNNKSAVINRTLTPNSIDQIITTVNWNEELESDNDIEAQQILERNDPKIKILENVILRPAGSNLVENYFKANETNHNILSDVVLVESTPHKKIHTCSSQKDEESILNVTLPPPEEFQDSEKDDLAKRDIPETPRRPLAAINKITSTPVSQKHATEHFLSLSPITCPKSQRMPKTRKPILGPIELAQQSKFSPLTIITKPPSQPIRSSQTPKQRSILNYISQGSENSQNKPVITCSRIGRDQMMAIASMTNKNLATYSAIFTPAVTHLVVLTNDKNILSDHTIKYISAVAAGIWVVNFGWVQECLMRNTLVPEEPYEVLDVSGMPGPKQSRLTRLTNPLFKGYKIHVAPPLVATTQQQIENVIKMLQGKVVPSPDHLLEKNGYICLIITEVKATQEMELLYETWLETLKVVTVDIEWFSRSVGQYKVLSVRPFTICSENSIDSLGYPPDLVANMTFSSSQQTFSTVPSTT